MATLQSWTLLARVDMLAPAGVAGLVTFGDSITDGARSTPDTNSRYAVIDFDKTTRDPNNPRQFATAYDSRDHLHPNDAGYKAMADAVDLGLFAMPTAH